MQVKGKESCVEVARTVCTEVSDQASTSEKSSRNDQTASSSSQSWCPAEKSSTYWQSLNCELTSFNFSASPFHLVILLHPFLHCHICYVNKIYSFPQTEDSLDNELCYYTYTGGQVDGEVLLLHIVLFCNSIPTLCHLIIRFSVDCYQPHQVKSVDVSYDLKCEDAPSHYGHGYGKDQSKVKMSTMSHGWHPMSRNFDPGVLQQTQNLPSHLKYHPGDPG